MSGFRQNSINITFLEIHLSDTQCNVNFNVIKMLELMICSFFFVRQIIWMVYRLTQSQKNTDVFLKPSPSKAGLTADFQIGYQSVWLCVYLHERVWWWILLRRLWEFWGWPSMSPAVLTYPALIWLCCSAHIRGISGMPVCVTAMPDLISVWWFACVISRMYLCKYSKRLKIHDRKILRFFYFELFAGAIFGGFFDTW